MQVEADVAAAGGGDAAAGVDKLLHPAAYFRVRRAAPAACTRTFIYYACGHVFVFALTLRRHQWGLSPQVHQSVYACCRLQAQPWSCHGDGGRRACWTPTTSMVVGGRVLEFAGRSVTHGRRRTSDDFGNRLDRRAHDRPRHHTVSAGVAKRGARHARVELGLRLGLNLTLTLSACAAQAELVERLGAPLERVLNEHQLRCVALAEQGARGPPP